VPPPCTDKSGEGGLSCTLDLWCTCASCYLCGELCDSLSWPRLQISSHYRVRYRCVERGLEGVVAASWAATHPECRTRP